MTLKITREVAAHVLWHFRGEGYQPGGFVESILIAFGKADTYNRLRLGHAFPEYYEAFTLGVEDPNGIEELRTIFRGESK